MGKPDTTKLTIRLPTWQVEFVKRFAKNHGVTVTEVLSRYFERLQEDTEEELHPDVQWLVGLLPPDADPEAARWEHYKEKYDL
ncbi:MAG: DUF6364 family protein [Xanthomonadales bacterium]|jgi:hypothetical protein|nr:DUF6364 family protein [Xanthomonadales bacterium]